MSHGTRSQDAVKAAEEEDILGDKATGGLDADQDHVGNVEGGLKAYVSDAILKSDSADCSPVPSTTQTHQPKAGSRPKKSLKLSWIQTLFLIPLRIHLRSPDEAEES